MPKQREPLALIEAKGKKHLTKAEAEQRRNSEVEAPANNIRAPNCLNDEMKQAFDEIAKVLVDIGIMTDLDCDALGRYIVMEYQFRAVTKKMMNIKNITDRYIDYSKLQSNFFKNARAAASDLGLSISSRCKLVVPKEPEKPQNKYMEFLNNGR